MHDIACVPVCFCFLSEVSNVSKEEGRFACTGGLTAVQPSLLRAFELAQRVLSKHLSLNHVARHGPETFEKAKAKVLKSAKVLEAFNALFPRATEGAAADKLVKMLLTKFFNQVINK